MIENCIRWFLARSDVEAAMRLARQENYRSELTDYAEHFWPHYFAASKYASIYQVAGQVEAQVSIDEVFEFIPRSWRFNAVWQAMHRTALEGVNILDFGASRCLGALHYHNFVPSSKWTCVEIDQLSIDQGKEIVQRKAANPQAFNFIVGDEECLLQTGYYDVAMVLETLEHVLDPQYLLRRIESSVKTGGLMILSVPSGPVESNMWIANPERNREHIREFLLDDLLDIFAKKEGLSIQYTSFAKNRCFNMLEGSFVVSYIVTGSPTEHVNWTRKLALCKRDLVRLPVGAGITGYLL